MHTVVIIDDSNTDRFIAEKVIESTALAEHIYCFSSGMAALAHLKSLREASRTFPTIIFLDIHMPGMSGFEFLEHFSRFPVTTLMRCAVVMLSSNNTPENIDKLKIYPFVRGYIRKPISDENVKAYLQ